MPAVAEELCGAYAKKADAARTQPAYFYVCIAGRPCGAGFFHFNVVAVSGGIVGPGAGVAHGREAETVVEGGGGDCCAAALRIPFRGFRFRLWRCCGDEIQRFAAVGIHAADSHFLILRCGCRLLPRFGECDFEVHAVAAVAVVGNNVVGAGAEHSHGRAHCECAAGFAAGCLRNISVSIDFHFVVGWRIYALSSVVLCPSFR